MQYFNFCITLFFPSRVSQIRVRMMNVNSKILVKNKFELLLLLPSFSHSLPPHSPFPPTHPHPPPPPLLLLHSSLPSSFSSLLTSSSSYLPPPTLHPSTAPPSSSCASPLILQRHLSHSVHYFCCHSKTNEIFILLYL